jgi:cobalt-zinc-cadmium resistance protein CzcA
LFLRGRSANLLSIGAVDFGIIVDSTVIMVENIYRYVSSGEDAGRPLSERIIGASGQVERSLFFSTVIMVCALLPLFTMQGPEGQIFGPMADTYAFALIGALVLALTLSPVLCLLFFRRLKPRRDNFLVRGLRSIYVWQLRWVLSHRLVAIGSFIVLCVVTFVATYLFMGREFMPELEEGNLWVRGTFPINISLPEATEKARQARAIMTRFPEVEMVQSQVGRPDDGTDPTGFYNIEFSIPLKPEHEWPGAKRNDGWRAWVAGHQRRRTREELVADMSAALRRELIGADWGFSQYIRDNVMEALSGVKGDNSVKIIGPDLDELEKLADRVKSVLDSVPGIVETGIFHIKGQPNLEFPVDREKCSRWGVSVNDVENVVQSAIGGKAASQMIEGEKSFDITLRWPAQRRSDVSAILDIPVDVTMNQVAAGPPTISQTPLTGASTGVASSGSAAVLPTLTGSTLGANLNNLNSLPRRPLSDLVTPVDAAGRPDPHGQFIRPGASTIFREQGNRLIAVKFSVRDRDLAGAVADAQAKTANLFTPPYRAEWSGEYQEMQEAERRMLLIVCLSLLLIMILLYLAFKSLLDAAVVLSNVLAMSLGGLWALLLTGTNFNISAAVGFISILGVAVMNGLLLVSAFNSMRGRGVELREALVQGVERLVRPVAMTAMAALFGLLPAALSTRIGAQSQRPLAIVVVGGMIMTLAMLNLVPFLYAYYGARQPVVDSGINH